MAEVLEFFGDFPSIRDRVLYYFDGDLANLSSIENGIFYKLGLCTEEVSICEVGKNFKLNDYISPRPVIDSIHERVDPSEISAVIRVKGKMYLFQLQDMNNDIENELFYNFDNLLFEE